MGIDTIRLSGACLVARLRNERLRRRVDVMTGTYSERSTGHYDLLADGTPLNVYPDPDGLRAVIEVSVPRLTYGTNAMVANVEDTCFMIERLHAMAGEVVHWLVPPQALRIDRLDVARDFHGVEDVRGLIAGLSQQTVTTRGVRSRLYTHRGTSTLYRGVRSSWEALLYDKTAEMNATGQGPGRQVRGHVRFEVRLRARRLRREAMRLPTDLTVGWATQIAAAYFQRAGFEQPVGGIDAVRAALEAMTTHADYKSAAPMIGTLLLDHLGLPQGGNPATVRKYRDLAAQHRIPPDLLSNSQPSRRLDFESGVAVAVD